MHHVYIWNHIQPLPAELGRHEPTDKSLYLEGGRDLSNKVWEPRISTLDMKWQDLGKKSYENTWTHGEGQGTWKRASRWVKAQEELLHGSSKRHLLLPSSLQSYIFYTKISNKSPKIWPIFLIIFIKPSVEDTVYGVPKVLFRRCERRHTGQQKHCHLFFKFL